MGADAFRFCFSLSNFHITMGAFFLRENYTKIQRKTRKVERHENSAKITKKAGAFKIRQIYLENVHAEPVNANSFFRVFRVGKTLLRGYGNYPKKNKKRMFR